MDNDLFRLEYYSPAADKWTGLPLSRADTLAGNVKYRVILYPVRVYYEIHEPNQFDCSCIQDLASFSYWLGYNNAVTIPALDQNAYRLGEDDRLGEKELR